MNKEIDKREYCQASQFLHYDQQYSLQLALGLFIYHTQIRPPDENLPLTSN